jgi:hypothetical protein
MSAWLIAFSEIEGLRWVLKHDRMIFSEGAARRAGDIQVGDKFVLYVTRGAFHSPTRDRSQLAGLAVVKTPVRRLGKAVTLAGREFVVGCGIELKSCFPERGGVPFGPLIQRMDFIRRKDAWGHYLRPGLVALSSKDFDVLHGVISREVRK